MTTTRPFAASRARTLDKLRSAAQAALHRNPEDLGEMASIRLLPVATTFKWGRELGGGTHTNQQLRSRRPGIDGPEFRARHWPIGRQG